ncbi:hypothetical protein CMO83_04285 [Candidatus Woesearchaeota archaeon]|jgi:hypothetical protein|nr:hypothetical protein [Candidatus Woesearchaeota archaeon]|tara:strand:- start:774 stop:1175 length:402 start_codon:yes stop_codon:yes gene_type:complete
MYKAKLWDEDKLNFNSDTYKSSKYGSIFSQDKKEDKKYNDPKYGSDEKDVSSDYMKKKDVEEEEKKKDSMFEEEKKEEKIKEEDIPFKAAKQVFDEQQLEMKKSTTRRKNKSSIDEAIKKAIEDEKKVIIMDS